MSILEFSEWLYASPASTAIRETSWIIPNIQSIHILAITVVIGSALATELRLAGVFAADTAVSRVLGRYLPWMKWALLVLLLTGALLVVAEPARTLGSTVFWTKMALVAGASLVTFRARKAFRIAGDGLPGQVSEPAPGKALAWLMLLTWGAIIFLGRFIAYV